MHSDGLLQCLARGLQRLSLGHVTELQRQRLLDYVLALLAGNRQMNLTSAADALTLLQAHILDSLTLAAFVSGRSRVLDFGTGAGLPGLPLAIIFPQINFVLLDSRGKRTRFIERVVWQLGLENVQVVHSRIEDFRDSVGFDTIVSRAVTRVPIWVDLTASVSQSDVHWLGMVAQVPDCSGLPAGYVSRVAPVWDFSSQDAKRHVVVVSRQVV